MKERERIIVSGLVLLMLLFWLGFVFHHSPRFAGSFWGGVLAISGSALMLVPLLYLFVKRIPPLKKWVTHRVPMRTLLAWHIYAGVLGPILVVLHTGHKFESALGIALTGMTLIVVVSGFVGRYLMTYFSKEIREKRTLLSALEEEYRSMEQALIEGPALSVKTARLDYFRLRLLNWISGDEESPREAHPALKVAKLAESIADVEYAIATHERFKSAFKTWLKFHIVIALVLYLLMALHVWASIHFGLRWFS